MQYKKKGDKGDICQEWQTKKGYDILNVKSIGVYQEFPNAIPAAWMRAPTFLVVFFKDIDFMERNNRF